MIDAVIFDLDETMMDRSASLAKYAAVFQQAFAAQMGKIGVDDIGATFLALDNRGYRPREEVYAGIAQKLPWLAEPDITEIGMHWRTWFPRSAIPRVGLHETLDSLTEAGIRLGIITNGTESSQSAKIVHLGISRYFSTVIISEVVQCEKPDSKIFQSALEQLGCRAGSTIFVGDHPINDVVGSAAAGLIPVWFEGVHSWPSTHPQPERRIRALPELLQFLHAQNGNTV